MGTKEKEKGEAFDGGPVGEDGQNKDYAVLPQGERDRGFVRPVRLAYRHVGAPAAKNPLRDLNEEEKERFKTVNYVKFEAYPGDGAVSGRYWTQEQLDNVGKGCGTVTSMGKEIAETYARDPKYYGTTFCGSCKDHLPVQEFVWNRTQEIVGS